MDSLRMCRGRRIVSAAAVVDDPRTSVSSGASSKFPPEGLTLEWYSRLGDQKQFLEAFRNSMLSSAGAVLLALVTGTMAALAIVHYPFPGRGLLRAFFMSPMVMPKITLGVAYLILFSKMHIAGGLFALILGGGHRPAVCPVHCWQRSRQSQSGTPRSCRRFGGRTFSHFLYDHIAAAAAFACFSRFDCLCLHL